MQGFEARATDSATCSQAMVSWNPVGLALCVRRFAVLSLFLLDLLQRSAFLRVFEGPKPSRNASGHAGSLPTLTCVSALVFSHAPAPALIHHLSKHSSHPPSLSLSPPSLSFHLCPSPSHRPCSLPLCLYLSLSLSVSLSLSLSENSFREIAGIFRMVPRGHVQTLTPRT